MSGIFKYNQNSTPNRRSHYGSWFGGSPSQDATMDNNSYGMGIRSPSMSGLNAGGGSPAQGRSVREYEEQMTSLRKENFNLKLRIYFLEEASSGNSHHKNNHNQQSQNNQNHNHNYHQLSNNSAGDSSADANNSHFKQNIDLKVEVESLKKELQEKQDLLVQAGAAMEIMEMTQTKNSDHYQSVIDDLNQHVKMLEMEVKSMQEEKNRIRDDDTGLIDFLGTMEAREFEVEQKVKILELENVIRQFHEQNEEMCRKIEDLEVEVSTKGEKIRTLEKHDNELCYDYAELKEKLEEKEKATVDSEIVKAKEQIFEVQKQLAEKMCLLDNANDKIMELTEEQEKACKIIHSYMKKIKDFEKEVNMLKKNSNPEEFMNDLKLDPAASALNATFSILDQNEKVVTQTDYDDLVQKKKVLQKKVDDLIQKVCSNPSERNLNIIIQQLNEELIEARSDVEKEMTWRKECVEICGILTGRLEELAGFLDSLLKNKEFVGTISTDRRKAIRKAVDRSLDLSRSLNNMSLSKNGMSFAENSSINLSDLLIGDDNDKENEGTESEQAKIIEKLSAENKALRGELEKNQIKKKDKRLTAIIVDQSDSEAWSEPDRDVSMARIGLEEKSFKCGKNSKLQQNVLQELSSTSENEENLFFKKPATIPNEIKMLHDHIGKLQKLIMDRDTKIQEIQGNMLESDNKHKEEKSKMADNLKRLQIELDNFKSLSAKFECEVMDFKDKVQLYDNQNNELTVAIEEKNAQIEKLNAEREQATVDIRVAKMKFETLKSDYADLQNKHKNDVENLVIREQEKFEKLSKEMRIEFDQEIQEKTNNWKSNLKENYVSKALFTEKLKELEEVREGLEKSQITLIDMHENEGKLRQQIAECEISIRQLEKSLEDATCQYSKISNEKLQFLKEKYALEEVMKMMQEDYDKLRMEKTEIDTKLSQMENTNAKLQNQLIKLTVKSNVPLQRKSDPLHSGYTSEEIGGMADECKSRLENSSPDLGIESDAGRLSNPESKAAVKYEGMKTESAVIGNIPGHDCEKAEQEITLLKQKVARQRRALEQTAEHIRNSNKRKEQLERDIQRQIQKTNKVLTTVRTNMEKELETKKSPSGAE